MMYSMFQSHRPLGSEEGDFLKVFTIIWEWVPVWSFERSFITTFKRPSVFRKRNLKMLNLSDLGQSLMNDIGLGLS